MRFLGLKFNVWVLIVIGSLIWSVTMVKSGVLYDYGLGFWGANGHDGIWHLALINSLKTGSLGMPIFAGEQIKNYHLGFDVLVAVLSKVSFVPASVWYFQILPPLLALGIGWITHKLTSSWWSTFLIYFGGSWAWVMGRGESTFWSQQAISTLINPPFALSLLMLLVGVYIVRDAQKLKNPKYFWAAVAIFALLPSIKVYAGVIGFLGLGLLATRDRTIFKLTVISGLIGAALFLPINRNASGLLVWSPGWFLETLVNLSDRVYLPRIYYWIKAEFFLKSLAGYMVALGIFIVGNLGTRILFLFHKYSFNRTEIFLLAGSLLGVVFPMLFVQQGTAWNTIQFFYYTQMFTAILAGLALSRFKPVWGIIIVLLTIPTTYMSLSHYLPSRPPAKVSNQELEALDFLKRQPKGIVLTPVFDKDAAIEAEKSPPRPLYLYTSTAYVSAFSEKPVYLEDEINLDITGYDWPTRRKLVEDFFKQLKLPDASNFLSQNNIEYIYLPDISKVRPSFSASQLGFESIFENSKTAIWKQK